MIDVHSHILPMVDDGAYNIDETMIMLKEAAKAGFTNILATSHYIDGEYEFNKNDRAYLIEALNGKIEEEGIMLKLHIGAEAYISNDLPKLIEEGIVPTLNNSKYVLFELPLRAKVMYTANIINKLVSMGLIPIIAHPERYDEVQDNPATAIDWINQGAMLQANYASIIGKYGNKAKETLIKLLDANAVHFLGTDTHRKHSVYTEMDEILHEFKKKIGAEKLKELTEINPRMILNNELFEIEMPKKIKKKKFL